jgi:hypothetical protein
MDCICFTKISLRKLASGKVRARNGYFFNAKSALTSDSDLRQNTGHLIGVKSKFETSVSLKAKNTHLVNLFALKPHDNFNINARLIIPSGNVRCRLSSSPELNIKYVDKFAGPLKDLSKYINFECTEKLYPVSDIVINSGDSYFVNESLSTDNLYASVDEGILSQEYDSKLTYIQPSSIDTEGSFRYKFAVDLHTVPRESLFLIRASAPFSNYASTIAPVYSIKNIRLEDPSGNLIVKYKDLIIRGDSDYNSDYVNFGTYITEPEINNAALNDWRANYEVFQSGTSINPYTVNIDVDARCLDFQFTDGYDLGYESGCALPSSIVNATNLPPTHSLRVTAIELCNKGEFFQNKKNYLPFYTEVQNQGFRLTKHIKPDQFLTYEHANNIYPEVQSIWTHRNADEELFDNITTSGANVLLGALNNLQDSIKLNYSSIADSGKLHLRFAWGPERLSRILFGDFNNDFDLTLSRKFYSTLDDFFTIDSIDLKVVAKKAVGTRDYYLDVVGYSDDKLLNVTSQVGGFLQNVSGNLGTYPTFSGFKSIDDLGISTIPISDKDQQFITNIPNNEGGDHYVLTDTPLVSGTSFSEYTVPLKIYDDRVSLGKSKDYSMSSSFENLYLDIYPLPSGAEISRIWLSVTFKPSNGLMLHTFGRAADKDLNRRNETLSPNEDISGYLGSLIENIPHAYRQDPTLKINYGNRWRGATGNVLAGPFNHAQFDLNFYNPPMYTPFLNGYFSFNYQDGSWVLPEYSFDNNNLDCVTSGVLVGSCEKISNIGLRFNSNSLFEENTNYTTIDWASTDNYYWQELNGQISDNFENAIKVTANSGYISFNEVNTSGGFAIYTRFSPWINEGFVEYLLYENGVVIDENNRPILIEDNRYLYSGIIFNNSDFAVGFSGGKLFGSCLDSEGNIVSIHGDKYYNEYNYPLPLMLSYNENDNKLRLYANDLIGTSEPFIANYSEGSLVFGSGMSGFITDIGISTLVGPSGHISESGINILSSGDLNKTLKQELYSNLSRKLYTYVDDKDWKFGDFKVCMFNRSYSRVVARSDIDFISHRLVSDGSGYINKTNLTLPTNINLSGVAYHSQIENDFLRFGLSEVSSLYAIDSRIQKTLPRGYKFEKEAICVDTVMQYESDNIVKWDNQNSGPKLIVSLYAPTKDPNDYLANNYGLASRDIHYLNSDCSFQKITSTFNFNALIDESEPWATFPEINRLNEFNHNYYSKDIEDMFLQYDLVYPSGSEFDSIIKLYSSTVRLKNALMNEAELNDNFNLYSSGDKVAFGSINMSFPVISSGVTDLVNLYASGSPIDYIGNLNIYTSGALKSTDFLSLYGLTSSGISNFDDFTNNPFSLYCFGNIFEDIRFPLFVQNNLIDQTQSGVLPIYVMNKTIENENNFIPLYVRGFESINLRPNANMSLYTSVTNVSPQDASMNLLTRVIEEKENVTFNSFNLFVVNIPILGVELGNQAIYWDSNNPGVNIVAVDNVYASLSADDEIRGVELICYGDCK